MKRLVTFCFALLLAACAASSHQADINSESSEKLTVGKVQREIKVGMTSAEVVEILGSPNMVSTDELRREVWVYDKVATETAYSKSEGGVWLLVLGASKSAGARSQSQKTLTIIVKFDENSRVRDFAYHSSKF
ncbi:outer membrane protein assembly factor BamE [Spongiibacter nanhainus]|uniref:Outer membrane protein assembly factor BamE n=1 Tax=Spongiibacter nanhainus TaxID=2794344 RepID=A0A7T4R0Z3_9GAMM|nr:outer membrane protein assembly factor BamE [Spongiibacter nanhainus]QQD18319.1 outer membrane protein assembly factor BamE [Spongiibacter nanhainus]